MARGPKKHLKRVNAPSSWHLSKMGGVYATRPAQGPHKMRESIPLLVILRNKLNYALNGTEAMKILKEKDNIVTVDKKVRRNPKFPCGLMDVVELEPTNEVFRVLYDVKKRFILVKIDEKEAEYKLCKIKRKEVGPNKIPYVVTHDGRTLRFANNDIKVSDTVKLNLNTNEIMGHYKMEVGNLAYIIGGSNKGRVGTITNTHKFLGAYEIVTLKDVSGKVFTTRMSNVFIIGTNKSEITLGKDNGKKLTIIEELELREQNNN